MSWGGDIDDGGDGGGDDIASVVRAMRRMGTFIERSLFPPCSMFHLSTVRSLPQVGVPPLQTRKPITVTIVQKVNRNQGV